MNYEGGPSAQASLAPPPYYDVRHAHSSSTCYQTPAQIQLSPLSTHSMSPAQAEEIRYQLSNDMQYGNPSGYSAHHQSGIVNQPVYQTINRPVLSPHNHVSMHQTHQYQQPNAYFVPVVSSSQYDACGAPMSPNSSVPNSGSLAAILEIQAAQHPEILQFLFVQASI
jgi:hypothetical protein